MPSKKKLSHDEVRRNSDKIVKDVDSRIARLEERISNLEVFEGSGAQQLPFLYSTDADKVTVVNTDVQTLVFSTTLPLTNDADEGYKIWVYFRHINGTGGGQPIIVSAELDGQSLLSLTSANTPTGNTDNGLFELEFWNNGATNAQQVFGWLKLANSDDSNGYNTATVDLTSAQTLEIFFTLDQTDPDLSAIMEKVRIERYQSA